jgi:hypothetical protein
MKSYTLASIVLLGLVLSFLLGNIAVSKVMAESGVGKDVFKVIVTLYGITNSTKDILTIINVGDETKVKLYSPENPTTEGSDKVSYTFAYPNMAVENGERYTVCTMSTDNFKLKCENGKNSPLDRPEFVDIKVSENSSKKVK